jgi:hypothetical protein
MPAPSAGRNASGDASSVYGTVGADAHPGTKKSASKRDDGAAHSRNRRSPGIGPGRLPRALAIFAFPDDRKSHIIFEASSKSSERSGAGSRSSRCRQAARSRPFACPVRSSRGDRICRGSADTKHDRNVRRAAVCGTRRVDISPVPRLLDLCQGTRCRPEGVPMVCASTKAGEFTVTYLPSRCGVRLLIYHGSERCALPRSSLRPPRHEA